MTYQSVVSGDNPVHFWRLADPGGFIAHDIGNTPHALSAAHYLGSLPYTGPNKDGGSAFMTNAAAFMTVDNVTHTYPISIEAWVWHIQRKASQQNVFSLELNGAGAGSLALTIDATGHPQLTSNSAALTAPNPIALNQWHHLVAVHTGAARRLYVDAVLVANDAQALASSPGCFSIGARGGDTGFYLEGCVSEVAYYTYALIVQQISNHYVAADNVAQRPIFRTTGTFNTVTGGSTVTQDSLDLVLASVRKTF